MKITVRHICIILFTAGILLLVTNLLYISEKNQEIGQLEENIQALESYLYLADTSAVYQDTLQQGSGYEKSLGGDKIRELAEGRIRMYRKIYNVPDSIDHYAAAIQVKIHIMEEILSLNEESFIFTGKMGKIMDHIILIFPPAVMLVWLCDLVFRRRRYR